MLIYWGNLFFRGLFAFATTTLVLSLFNVQARHITHANVVLGLAVAMGGLSQLLAGQWEFVAGNTFGATVRSVFFPPVADKFWRITFSFTLGIHVIRCLLDILRLDLNTRNWCHCCLSHHGRVEQRSGHLSVRVVYRHLYLLVSFEKPNPG